MPRSPGRPSLYHPDKAIPAAEAGGGMDAIAERLGVGRRRLQKWMHRHPGFAEAVQRGRKADAITPDDIERAQRAASMRHELDELITDLRALPDAPEASQQLADAPEPRASLHHEIYELVTALRALPPEPRKAADPRVAELAAELQREIVKIAPQQSTPTPDDRLDFAIALARQERPSEAAEGAKPRITEMRRPTAPAERNPVDAADADPDDDPEWQRINVRHRLVRPKSWCAPLDDPRDGW